MMMTELCNCYTGLGIQYTIPNRQRVVLQALGMQVP